MSHPDADNDPRADAREIAKFDALAAQWWDLQGAFKPLHDINPLRLAFVEAAADLTGKRVVDVGCGGGILAESMAERGAAVTGIDAGEGAIATARAHARQSDLAVEYQCTTAEAFARLHPGGFDLVTCMELLEHVPHPASLVSACAALARPGGEVIFSTINRNPKAYLLAVIGAEYLLGLLPRGTHDYAKFIRPSELAAWSRPSALQLESLQGFSYNPVTRRYRPSADVAVNYLARFRKTGGAGG